VIPGLLAEWRAGAQIVWAVRAGREGESAATIGFSRLYYFLMRRVVGMAEMPPTGADFFLADRVVLDAFARFRETNTSLFALLTWMGFRQASVLYVKQSRLHGRSNWTLGKKVKLVLDSVTSFTYMPIRAMSCLGVSVALLGFLYAGSVVRDAWTGHPADGWASLMIVVLVLGGTQMLMMGVLGEYLWRTFDESRRRPSYLVEAVTPRPGGPGDTAAAPPVPAEFLARVSTDPAAD
jgi:polyisoprenyl-phosphate glycosyltransferase